VLRGSSESGGSPAACLSGRAHLLYNFARSVRDALHRSRPRRCNEAGEEMVREMAHINIFVNLIRRKV
jgi:hypothetical protein